jgi:non-ribosomal peptide synthetase component F
MEPNRMSDRLDLILVTINALNSAAITLTEYARDIAVQGETARLSDFEEAPELIADALIVALESLSEDRMNEARNQLLGALRRYVGGCAE